MDIFREQVFRQNELARHAENSARLAQVHAKFRTVGQGTLTFEDRIEFGLTFVEEPFVYFGSSMDQDEFAEMLELDSDIPEDEVPIPLCSGVVTRWDRDERDFYVGAWVGIRVHFPSDSAVFVDYNLLMVMEHYFTFSGIAMKDVPVDLPD